MVRRRRRRATLSTKATLRTDTLRTITPRTRESADEARPGPPCLYCPPGAHDTQDCGEHDCAYPHGPQVDARAAGAIFAALPVPFVVPLDPGALAEINGEDAKALNVVDGDYVHIVSRRGSLRIKTLVSDTTDRGVAFVPFSISMKLP